MGDLSNVKVGDKLIFNGGITNRKHVITVERITKAQIHTKNGGAFWLRDGRAVGSATDRWDFRSVRLPKSGEIKEIQETNAHEQRIGRLHGYAWNGLSRDKAKRIIAILEEKDSERNN